MSKGSNYLDRNRPDAVRLSVNEAGALGEGALAQIGMTTTTPGSIGLARVAPPASAIDCR
jgi:hypothetical protein